MKRRDFLTKGLGAGVFAGSLLPLGRMGQAMAEEPISENGSYDLVAIKGAAPDVMFDKGIASLGGMQRFVKPGQTVVVKPNIGWDSGPERAANTNPVLVKRVVEHCFKAGAKEVYAFDHTCDEWTRCYKNSGIEKAVKDAGGKLVTGDSESYYQDVEIADGAVLKDAKVHQLMLESDVVINVPILKSHGGATLSIAMKNLMGVVWNRRFWHRNDLHQCIADFATYCKPQLNIVDAYNVMMQNGPRGVSEADVARKGYLVISPDMVAADAAAAKIFGIEPEEIPHIKIANAMGAGVMDLEKLSIKRITV
ncbi:MAG: DUF362 domain-containing protein [Gammaproteobacteria bacterium]|nr:DUF362 domain-containing protein [Gammaproteobacteria bacterium]